MTSRRNFIKKTFITTSGIFIIPRHVLGKGFIPPSDKLNIAGIGAGGKGESDLLEFTKSPYVNIVSLCDIDDKSASKSRERNPKATYYKDFRKLLDAEKGNIDAVSVSTPDHTHAIIALKAMEMGKHVYVQKPMAHDIYEVRQMTEAALKYKVVTQMGNQGGSGEGARRIQEWINNGLIGEVTKVNAWTNRPVWPQNIPTPTGKIKTPKGIDWNLWVGPSKKVDYNPAYHPFNWRGWWDFGTGALGDMACHILDPVFRALPIDYPDSVSCSVPNSWKDAWVENGFNDSCPVASILHFDYTNRITKKKINLSWYDGGILPQRPDELLPDEPMGSWDGGVIFEGESGKIMCGCYGENPTLLPTNLMTRIRFSVPTLPRVPEGHYVQWVNACIAGYGKNKVSSPFEYAGPFTESILMGNIAIRSFTMKNPTLKGWGDKYLGRKKLLWDAQNMKITNFEEANKFIKRDYRPF